MSAKTQQKARVGDRVTIHNIRSLGHQAAVVSDFGVVVQNLGGIWYQPASVCPVPESALWDGSFEVRYLGSAFVLRLAAERTQR